MKLANGEPLGEAHFEQNAVAWIARGEAGNDVRQAFARRRSSWRNPVQCPHLDTSACEGGRAGIGWRGFRTLLPDWRESWVSSGLSIFSRWPTAVEVGTFTWSAFITCASAANGTREEHGIPAVRNRRSRTWSTSGLRIIRWIPHSMCRGTAGTFCHFPADRD